MCTELRTLLDAWPFHHQSAVSDFRDFNTSSMWVIIYSAVQSM